jgi:hypothetical protein
MPEQITKYPDVTLEVLKGAGAACGTGAPQKILTQCPAERFCALPTGEMCIYGLADIPRMTQVSVGDLARVVEPGRSNVLSDYWVEGAALAAVFVLGVAVGSLARRAKGNVRQS